MKNARNDKRISVSARVLILLIGTVFIIMTFALLGDIIAEMLMWSGVRLWKV